MSISASRTAAGAAYAAAAQAYADAWVELQAYDLATRQPGGFGAQPVIAGHSEFLRDLPAITRDPAGRAAARHIQIRREGNADE